jgi:lysozyme family protein
MMAKEGYSPNKEAFMAEFNQAIEYVLANEGGFVSNPNDSGGVTNFGVTIPMLTSYRKKQVTTQDMQNLTQAEAKLLYQSFFWDRLHISGLNQAIATAILDTAVNEGQITAVKLAQHCIGPSIMPDGIMGPATLQALDKTNPDMFIYSYIGYLQDRYADFCINATNQLVFIKGWLRRSRRLFTLLDLT